MHGENGKHPDDCCGACACTQHGYTARMPGKLGFDSHALRYFRMIDDPSLPPPVMAAHVAGTSVEFSWAARGNAQSGYLVWISSIPTCLWLGPGDTSCIMTLPTGSHAAVIRATGDHSIGSWSEPTRFVIGDISTDTETPPESWCMGVDFAGSWIVIGPGIWSGRVFDDISSAQAFMQSRSREPADFNNDGFVNPQDFFDFLGEFFNNNGDWNGNGTTDSSDLFDFISDLFR